MDENYIDIPMLDSSEYVEIYSGIPWDGDNQYLKINLTDETIFKLVNPKNRLKRDDYYQIIIYQTSSGKGIISFDNIFKFSNKNEKAISKEKNSSTVFNLYSGIWGNSLDIISKKINSPKVRLGRTTLDASNVQNTSNVELSGSGNVAEQQYLTATHTRDGILSKDDWTTFNNKQDLIVLDNIPMPNSSNLVNSGGIHFALRNKINISDLNSYQLKNEKNQANGYVGLDSNVLISPNQIPDCHPAITLGSNDDGLNLFNQILSLNIANSTQTGALSSSDWNTFNNKQDSIILDNNPISNSSNLINSGSVYSALQNKVDTLDLINYQIKDEKNQANGYVGLDSNILINPNQIPDYHPAVTLGSNDDGLNLFNQILSLNIANSAQTGALSSSDWNTFNNKQDSIILDNNPISNSSNLINSGSVYSALQNKVDTLDLINYQIKDEKNQANGYVGLDSNILINPDQIPDYHPAITLGSDDDGLNLFNQILSLNIANSAQTGALSSSDWNTFNDKQDSLGLLDYQIENILETPFTRSLRKISIYEDWIGSDIKGTIGWNSGVANSATLGIVSSMVSPSNLGILGLSTQSNALGRASIYTADSNGYGCGYMLEGNICMRWVVRISSLFSLGVDEFFIKIGLSNNVSSTTENCLNGVVFSYKGTSSAHWEIVGTNTGVETRINTTELVIANQWTILDMEYNNTDGAIFKINNNYVGTIGTNNLPTTVLLGLHARINKTLGTSTRSLYIDKCFFTRH